MNDPGRMRGRQPRRDLRRDIGRPSRRHRPFLNSNGNPGLSAGLTCDQKQIVYTVQRPRSEIWDTRRIAAAAPLVSKAAALNRYLVVSRVCRDKTRLVKILVGLSERAMLDPQGSMMDPNDARS
jgi:hypothetical protein